ncbi:MAG: hypothetical protein IPM48_09685 [Saprospiraceae bacterium]|nr:hypothetical protein [Saprospiraceae bacterium]
MKTYVIIILILTLNSCTPRKKFYSCTIEKNPYGMGQYNPINESTHVMTAHIQNEKNGGLPINSENNQVIQSSNKEDFKKVETQNFYTTKETLPIPPTKKQSSHLKKKTESIYLGKRAESTKKRISIHTIEHKKYRNGNRLIYLAAVLMALTTFGMLRMNKSRATKLTRWAKTNPKKAQLFIALLQIPLILIAFITGHNLRELGYELTNVNNILFGILAALGFLLVPFLYNSNQFTLPKVLNRQRAGYLAIIISSTIIVTSFGNQFTVKFPNSTGTKILYSVDNAITTQLHSSYSDELKGQNTLETDQIARKKAAVILTLFAILGIIYLVVLICAGICLTIYGISLLVSGMVLGLAWLILGALLIMLCIRGIRSLNRFLKKEKTKSK